MQISNINNVEPFSYCIHLHTNENKTWTSHIFVTQVYCADNNSIYVYTEVFRNLTRGVPSPRMTWASPPSFAWCAPPCACVPRGPSVSWTRPGHWNRQTGINTHKWDLHKVRSQCSIFSNLMLICFRRHSVISINYTFIFLKNRSKKKSNALYFWEKNKGGV